MSESVGKDGLLESFQRDGYAIIPGFLTTDELSAVQEVCGGPNEGHSYLIAISISKTETYIRILYKKLPSLSTCHSLLCIQECSALLEQAFDACSEQHVSIHDWTVADR